MSPMEENGQAPFEGGSESTPSLKSINHNRDQTFFPIHLHLLDPEGCVITRALKALVLTIPEGSNRC